MRRALLTATLALHACAPPPGPTPPRVQESADAAAPVAQPSPRKCRTRDPGQGEILESLAIRANQTELGAIKTDHAQLVRFFPTLHESGTVRSIVATHALGEHGPIYALTLLVRTADGGLDAHLGFATAPCAGGDLALASTPVPLGVPEAILDWSVRVPLPGAPLTELKIRAGDAPNPLYGPDRGHRRLRDYLVGTSTGTLPVIAPKGAAFGVVGSFAVESELPPHDGIRREDTALIGTGWYAQGSGAGFLLVHRAASNRDDMCNLKVKTKPASPIEVRLAARIDPKAGLLVQPEKVGNASVIAIGENQPAEAVSNDASHTLRSGVSETTAQWLHGLYDSVEEAKAHMGTMKYRTGTIITTPGTLIPKKKESLAFECEGLY